MLLGVIEIVYNESNNIGEIAHYLVDFIQAEMLLNSRIHFSQLKWLQNKFCL